MISLDTIEEIMEFIVIEVQAQLNLTLGVLFNRNEHDISKIISKDDYVDNLKNRVEDKCFSMIHSSSGLTDKHIKRIRAIHVISVNLERIADFFVNIAKQTDYLADHSPLQKLDTKEMFSEIRTALSKILPVYVTRDLSGALDICKVELTLDKMYKTSFDWIMDQLRQSGDIPNLLTTLFIFRYLERIGDSLLNIGEALLFSILGERIKIRQFEALRETLSKSGFDGPLSDIDFQAIWGSRSGCRISKVHQKLESGTESEGVFKEGNVQKILKEKNNIREWDAILPGIAPRVFGYHEQDDKASLLVEFISGQTLDEVVLTSGDDLLYEACEALQRTLLQAWRLTRTNGPVSTDYFGQLKSRLSGVSQVHPASLRPQAGIDDLDLPSSRRLVEECAQLEGNVPAPFTVFIHGDFNISNVVYDYSRKKIRFIDLYRSQRADYVQDASVFLVSNFRLPVFEPELRKRLNGTIKRFYSFFGDYARENQDVTFEFRMTLALARSFFTSTRFELNQSFAKEMLLRSHFLMEKLIAQRDRPAETFRLPESVLYY